MTNLIEKIKDKIKESKTASDERKAMHKEIEAEIRAEMKDEVKSEVKAQLKEKMKQEAVDGILGKKKMNPLVAFGNEFKGIATDEKLNSMLGRKSSAPALSETKKKKTAGYDVENGLKYMLGKK